MILQKREEYDAIVVGSGIFASMATFAALPTSAKKSAATSGPRAPRPMISTV